MTVLGIDPGLATTGFGVIEKKKGIVVTGFGTITTPKNTPLPHRLTLLFQDIQTLLVHHKPDRIVVEKLFFFKNQKTVMEVGQARGIILLACALTGIIPLECTPLQVKTSLTGYGRATKKQIQYMVKKVFHLTTIPRSDDAADALAIAYHGLSLRSEK